MEKKDLLIFSGFVFLVILFMSACLEGSFPLMLMSLVFSVFMLGVCVLEYARMGGK